HRAGGNPSEDRLDISSRAADDAKDLARRRLLVERFAEGGVARLERLEQPDVLDGDDGLVGEGLHELDLRGRERLDLASSAPDGPDRHAGAGERDAETSAI